MAGANTDNGTNRGGGAAAVTWMLARRAAVPLFAVAVAVAFLPSNDLAIADGTCRGFEGAAGGNDPSAMLEFTLCRHGDVIAGTLSWTGKSGESKSRLLGDLDAEGRIRLVDAEAVVDEPNPGWMFCYDDSYVLSWDQDAGALIGTYRSEQCDDTGVMRLQRTEMMSRWGGCHSR